MRMTIYAYPWDLARLGVQRSLQEIAGHGIAAIDLAANYHPIDTYSPRDGGALFTDARGAVYFPARGERYGRIRPQVHSPEIARAWGEAAEAAHGLGLDLNAWTISLFQPWIRDAYPDCARVLPTGEASGSGLCAANPDLREYLVTLCEDMVDQFGIRMVRLESIMSVFDFDWLRPRVMVALPPLARELLNLCFCPSCKQRAAAQGIDAEALRQRVKQAIAAEIDEGPGGAGLAGDADLAAYAELAMRAATELVGAIAARLAGRARLSINVAASFAGLLGQGRGEELLGEFIASADQLELIPGHAGNEQASALARGASPPREISALIPFTGAAGRSDPARQQAAARVEGMVRSGAQQGASELCLYNYGLIRESDIAEFAGNIRRDYP